MKTATTLDELHNIIEKDRRVVVAFSQPATCVPCRRLAPHFKAASERIPGTTFVEVDIDKSPEIRDEYDIMSVPFVVMFVGGKLSGELKGRTLIQLQNEILSSN